MDSDADFGDSTSPQDDLHVDNQSMFEPRAVAK